MPSLPTGRPLDAPTPAPLSPAQAAQWAKVSRRTLMRAIEAGELPAFRDNRNRWQISPEELGAWASAHWAANGQRPLDAQPCPPVAQLPAKPAQDDPADDRAAARLTIAQLEARLDERAALVRAAEARAEAAEADRDRWRALAEKLTDRPTAPAAPEPASASSPASVPSPRRWWPWRRG